MSRSCREAGSVLFLILIAVVLFAALSYAVTQTTRGGGIDPSKEKAELLVAELIQWTTSLQTAALRMKISNGCEDEQFSIGNDFYKKINGDVLKPEGYNPNSPANGECSFFRSNGGGLSPRTLSPDALMKESELPVTSQVPGSIIIYAYGIPQIGSVLPEIVVVISNINKKTCMALNEKFKITDKNIDPPERQTTGSGGGSSNFYSQLGPSNTMIYSNPEFSGKQDFCYKLSSPDRYSYVSVLIVR